MRGCFDRPIFCASPPGRFLKLNVRRGLEIASGTQTKPVWTLGIPRLTPGARRFEATKKASWEGDRVCPGPGGRRDANLSCSWKFSDGIPGREGRGRGTDPDFQPAFGGGAIVKNHRILQVFSLGFGGKIRIPLWTRFGDRTEGSGLAGSRAGAKGDKPLHACSLVPATEVPFRCRVRLRRHCRLRRTHPRLRA